MFVVVKKTKLAIDSSDEDAVAVVFVKESHSTAEAVTKAAKCKCLFLNMSKYRFDLHRI